MVRDVDNDSAPEASSRAPRRTSPALSRRPPPPHPPRRSRGAGARRRPPGRCCRPPWTHRPPPRSASTRMASETGSGEWNSSARVAATATGLGGAGLQEGGIGVGPSGGRAGRR
jgi:hypothetical protein